MPPSNLVRLRRICMAFPESTEVEAWGSSTFRCKRIFAMHASPNDHHGDGREGVWVKTDSFTQDLLLHNKPKQYFKPPYVGPFGWTGVYLNTKTNWTALTDLLRDAYCLAAPKKLTARMNDLSNVALSSKKKSVTLSAKREGKRPARRKTKR